MHRSTLTEAYCEDVIIASRDDPMRVQVFSALGKHILPEHNFDPSNYEILYVFTREAGQVVANTRKLMMVTSSVSHFLETPCVGRPAVGC